MVNKSNMIFFQIVILYMPVDQTTRKLSHNIKMIFFCGISCGCVRAYVHACVYVRTCVRSTPRILINNGMI